jgi:hypothetical protein
MVTFTPDTEVAKVAERYALEALDTAAQNFQTPLDWTEASIELVEAILGKLHGNLAKQRPPEAAVWMFAKGFGSYVGEVYRRHHGGQWGIVLDDGSRFTGMEARDGGIFLPWNRAHKRIVEGANNDVGSYYQFLSGKARRSG